MNGPGRDVIDAGLYNEADFERSAATVRRLNTVHRHRLKLERAGQVRGAVEDAKTAQSLIAAATPAELRAMVVQLTTPELKAIAAAVAEQGSSVERYCVASDRPVKHEGDRCLVHGDQPQPCRTDIRAAQCTHRHLSPNHPEPCCAECGKSALTVPASPAANDGVDGLAAAAPAVPGVDALMGWVIAYGNARAEYAMRAVTEHYVDRARDDVRSQLEALALAAFVGQVDRQHGEGRLP